MIQSLWPRVAYHQRVAPAPAVPSFPARSRHHHGRRPRLALLVPRATTAKHELRVCTNRTCRKQGSQQVKRLLVRAVVRGAVSPTHFPPALGADFLFCRAAAGRCLLVTRRRFSSLRGT